MALINVEFEDSWLSEFSGLERLAQQLQRNIGERNCQTSTQGDYLRWKKIT